MNYNKIVNWLINAEIFETNSAELQKDLYASLLKLPNTKILCDSSLPNDTMDKFGIEYDRIVDSIIEDTNTYLISPASTNFIAPAEIKHLLILHALDNNNLDKTLKHAKEINADAILSHLFPDEISDEFDSNLIRYYSNTFIYLPAIISDTEIANQTSKGTSLIYDTQFIDRTLEIFLPILKTAYNSSAKSADEEMSLIKWNQVDNSQINNISGDHITLLMGDTFKLSYLCEFLESQNTQAVVSTPSLSPIRSLFTDSIEVDKYKIEQENISQRTLFKKLLADLKQKQNSNSNGNRYRTHFTPDTIIQSICNQITGESVSDGNSILDLIESLYSQKHCKYSIFSTLVSTSDKSYSNEPHWFKNPFMPNVFFSAYRYIYKTKTNDGSLVPSMQSILNSIETSLSKISKTQLSVLCYKASEDLLAELILAEDKTEIAKSLEPLVDYANSIRNSKPDEWCTSTVTSFIFYAATKELLKSEAIIKNTSNIRNDMLPMMAWFYWITGNNEGSREVLAKIDLDKLFHQQIPHCAFLLVVGLLMLADKQYEKSIHVFNEFVRLFPGAFTNHLNVDQLISHWLLASIYATSLGLSNVEINEFIDHPINQKCPSYHFQKDLFSKLDLILTIPEEYIGKFPVFKIKRSLNP